MDIRRGYAAASGVVGLATCIVVMRFATWPIGIRLAAAGAMLAAAGLIADALRRFG